MEKAKVSIKQIWPKASSKKEIYRILQHEGDLFLPPPAEANHAYILKLIAGRRKYRYFII